jgi:hypothetical protein
MSGNSIIKSDTMFQMTKLLLCWHQYPFLFYCQRTVGLHLTSDGTLMSIYLSYLLTLFIIYHFSNLLYICTNHANPLISFPIFIYTPGKCATGPTKFIMTAASQGATAAAKVNSELFNEEFKLDNN